MAKKSADQTLEQPGENQAVELVKMSRDVEVYPAPHEADVHPDEVDNFLSGGWVVDKNEEDTI